MNSPPYFSPLYFVKRGKTLKNRALTPSLRSREGAGGEFMGFREGAGGEFMGFSEGAGGENMRFKSLSL